MQRTRTTIPGKLSDVLKPGDKVKVTLKNPLGTITPIIIHYTENGLLYEDVYYTNPSSLMEVLNARYRNDRKKNANGWKHFRREEGNITLYNLRTQFNLSRYDQL